MKKYLLTSATVFFIGLTAFSQEASNGKKWYVPEYPADNSFPKEIEFEVRGRYTHPVKKEKLDKAKFLRDFIPNYPSTNWIADYVSVDISAIINGKSMKGVSANDALSPEQKSILNTADLGTDITVSVKYKSKNTVTDIIENKIMNVTVTIIPEINAEYLGGYQQLKKYLRENAINKISATTPKEFQRGIVTFTINEKGEIVNAKISKSSGDQKTDNLLLEVINKMPDWKPAENLGGIKVKQEFEFSIYGMAGC